jgi:uncharacterized protein (TIGR02145 family)
MCFAQNIFTDSRDGKKYKIAKIGTQTWLAQNLDYGGEDGDIGACLGNDPKNCQKYGRLYTWDDAMIVCPDGWHLPNYDEWQTLTSSAGGGIAGQKLKARNGWEKWTCEWTTTDDRGRTKKNSKCNSDNFGFSALPSSSNAQSGYWWMASESSYRASAAIMLYNSESMHHDNYNKTQALSVRCIKGEGKLPSNFVIQRRALVTAEAEKKAKKAEMAAEAANPLITEVTNNGTILRGSTLAKKLAWLDKNAESDNTYTIEVNADESIEPYTFEYNEVTNISIVLRGDSINRTIKLKSNGAMFTVKENVTFILNNNITLQGHSSNTTSVVWINGGKFTMNGGIISGNTATNGGGVYIDGTFTMDGGKISGNTATYGGGVYRASEGNFIMKAGVITNNIARENGGGVYVQSGFFVTFSKTGGTITGYDSDQNNGNVVKKANGVITHMGHAVYVDDKHRKETTVEQNANLSTSDESSWAD